MMFKKILLTLALCALTTSAWADYLGVLTNSTARDTVAIPFNVLDSIGSPTLLASGDSVYVVVYSPNGTKVFADSMAYNDASIKSYGWEDFAGRQYVYAEQIENMTGTGEHDGLHTIIITVQDLTSAALVTATMHTYYLYETATYDTELDSIGLLAGDAIAAANIAADAIGASELATDAIGAAEIAANAIGASEIATDAIGAAEFAASAITKILDSLFTTRVDADTATNSYFGSLLNDLTAMRDSLQFLITSSGDTAIGGDERDVAIDAMRDSLQFLTTSSGDTAIGGDERDLAIAALHDSLNYNGEHGRGIFIDSTASNTNTVIGNDGTEKNPVSTLAAARTLALALGSHRFYIHGGSTFNDAANDLAADYSEWEFYGEGFGIELAFGGQLVTNSLFHNIKLSGAMHASGGAVHYVDCQFGFISSNFQGNAEGCEIIDSIVTRPASEISFHECYSGLAPDNTPTIDFGAGANTVVFTGYSGGIRFMNGSSNDKVAVSTDGHVIISANNTSLRIMIHGMVNLTDSGTTTDMTKDAVFSRKEAHLWIWGNNDTLTVDSSLLGEWLSTGISATISAQDKADIADSVHGHKDTAWASGTMGDQLLDHSDTLKLILDSINNLATVTQVVDSVWKSIFIDRDDVAGSFADSATNWAATAASGLDSGIVSRIVGRKAWGIAAGSGSDSSTLAQRKSNIHAVSDDEAAADSLEAWLDGYANTQLTNREVLLDLVDSLNIALDSLEALESWVAHQTTSDSLYDSILIVLDSLEALESWIAHQSTSDTILDSLGFYPDGVGANLVLNPGFERDSVSGAAPEFWTQGDGTHTADISRTSTVGGRWDFRLDPAANETSFVYQKIGNLPDGDYLLSATGKSDVTSTAWVVLDNIAPTTVSTHIDSITFPTTFEEVGKLVTLSSGTNTIFIGLRADGIAAGVPGDFDNVKLIYLGRDSVLLANRSEIAAQNADSLLHADFEAHDGTAGSFADSAQGWGATAASSSDTANIRAMLLHNFDLPPNKGQIRFIDVDGTNADGLTIKTAWTDFTKGVGDTADYIYYVMPGTYNDPVITITASNVTLEAVDYGSVLMRNTDSAWNNTMVQVNDSDDAGPIYTANISNIKIKGFDFAYTQMGGLPADPKFQAAIWVFDSSYNVEIAWNTFGLDSTFKSIAIEDVSAYNYVHDNRFFRSHTHAIDAACDYSIFERNFIMDTRDYLGGPSGANSTEPIQITSKGNHNIVNGNYITSGSVMYRIQGDTNLIAGNYAGKATFDDGREYMTYAVGGDSSYGNTFAGNWGPGHNLDTSGLGAGRKSLPVIRDLITSNHDQFDTLTAQHGSGSWAAAAAGSGGNSIYLGVTDTSGTDTLVSAVYVTLKDNAGNQIGIAQKSNSEGYTIWNLDENDTVHARINSNLQNQHVWPSTSYQIVIGSASQDTFAVALGAATDSILMGHDYSVSAPGSGNLCTVYGDVYDILAADIEDVVITVSMEGQSVMDTVANRLIWRKPRAVTTNASGHFEIVLLRSSQTKPKAVYVFEAKKGRGPSAVVFKSIKVIVPDSTTYRLNW